MYGYNNKLDTEVLKKIRELSGDKSMFVAVDDHIYRVGLTDKRIKEFLEAFILEPNKIVLKQFDKHHYYVGQLPTPKDVGFLVLTIMKKLDK